MLEEAIRRAQKPGDVLLMTHTVVGYPSLEASYEIIRTMVDSGVELIELQIPFSEPIADGPVILQANQAALEAGVSVNDCFELAERVCREFPIPFLFMSYYNILFKAGVASFLRRAKDTGIQGLIVPDLPPEEGTEYLALTKVDALDPVLIFSPNTSDARLAYLAEHARGLVYCVARRGVTGHKTQFSQELADYLARCRRATSLPLALGFGVKGPDDIRFLRGKVDVAVVGTETLRILQTDGVRCVGPFLRNLRR